MDAIVIFMAVMLIAVIVIMVHEEVVGSSVYEGSAEKVAGG